ncbi:MAG: hypothetical protein ABR555_07850 [Pyrinomonadaceae bacterium]
MTIIVADLLAAHPGYVLNRRRRSSATLMLREYNERPQGDRTF